MIKKILVLFSISILLLVSCDKMLMKEKRQEFDKINLRGLLDTLHVQVYQANPLLLKKATLDDNFDSVALHLDSAGWQKEFQNFSDLKLRPGNLQSQFDESITESDSCLVYHYHAKDFEKEDLDSFLIGSNSKKEVRFLKAFINTENFFSSSSQKLEIYFKDDSTQVHLPTSYSVKGWQKIKSKDTINFSIDAEIRY